MPGKVMAETDALSNIVYPLVRSPWSGFFVGCRTGAAYFMDENLAVRRIGDFGGGVYGVAYSHSLDRLFIGGRDGTLFSVDKNGKTAGQWSTSANRLWNLCPEQTSDRYMLASSYNGALYKLDGATGEIVWQREFGPGATTLISRLGNGNLAVGSLKKKILLLDPDGVLIKSVPARGGVCFIQDLPELGAFYATDHDGRIWIMDHDGRGFDRFDEDVAPNNPVWTAEQFDTRSIIAAWANSVIRVLNF